MITIVAKCTVKEGMNEEFTKLAYKLIAETRKEEACVSYELFQDIDNKNIYTFIENWETREAIDKHMNTEHFTTIVPKLKETQICNSDMNLYEKIK